MSKKDVPSKEEISRSKRVRKIIFNQLISRRRFRPRERFTITKLVEEVSIVFRKELRDKNATSVHKSATLSITAIVNMGWLVVYNGKSYQKREMGFNKDVVWESDDSQTCLLEKIRESLQEIRRLGRGKVKSKSKSKGERILTLLYEGRNQRYIAQEMKCSPSAISRWLKRRGIRYKRKGR